jgi:hypothetical protein
MDVLDVIDIALTVPDTRTLDIGSPPFTVAA